MMKVDVRPVDTHNAVLRPGSVTCLGLNSFLKSELPNYPKSPQPHVYSRPNPVLTATCLSPHDSYTTLSYRKPDMKHGWGRAIVSPSPNSPSRFSPHENSNPFSHSITAN